MWLTRLCQHISETSADNKASSLCKPTCFCATWMFCLLSCTHRTESANILFICCYMYIILEIFIENLLSCIQQLGICVNYILLSGLLTLLWMNQLFHYQSNSYHSYHCIFQLRCDWNISIMLFYILFCLLHNVNMVKQIMFHMYSMFVIVVIKVLFILYTIWLNFIAIGNMLLHSGLWYNTVVIKNAHTCSYIIVVCYYVQSL